MLSLDNEVESPIYNVIDFDARLNDRLALLGETTQNIKLLALNASIEALHATAFIDGFKDAVSDSLLGQAYITALFIEKESVNELASLALECGLTDYAAADENGIVTHSNNSSLIGHALDSRFINAVNSQDAKPVSYDVARTDDKHYISAARAGAFGKGAIMLGTFFTPPDGVLTIDSFKVVAIEVKNQADSIKEAVDAAKRHIAKLSAHEYGNVLEKRRIVRMAQNELATVARITKVISLLGIRAKIEAAQMTNDRVEFDKLSNIHLELEARLMARLFAIEGADCALAERVLKSTGIGIWITDGDGVVEITNSDDDIGFKFVDGGTTAPFYPILKDPTYIAAPPPVTRNQDGRTFKFVGVGRLDKTGIVQVGIPSDIFNKSNANGFTIVATEIREMAEQLSSTAGELSELVGQM